MTHGTPPLSQPKAAPRLSIILATWSAAATLEACLRSIAEQEFRDFELIVIDGGSGDGTVAIIERHAADIAYWHSQPDHGIYDAWNTALDHARGEYVCFIGADDAWCDAQSLQRIFSQIGDGQFDLVSSQSILLQAGRPSQHVFGQGWDFRRLEKRICLCHPGLLHRRDLFERFGRFDSALKIVADYEFLLRLPEDLRTLHVPLPTVFVGLDGISRNRRWLMLREKHRVQSRCPRIGPLRAHWYLLDKLWRIPVAKLLGIPN